MVGLKIMAVDVFLGCLGRRKVALMSPELETKQGYGIGDTRHGSKTPPGRGVRRICWIQEILV